MNKTGIYNLDIIYIWPKNQSLICHNAFLAVQSLQLFWFTQGKSNVASFVGIQFPTNTIHYIIISLVDNYMKAML